MANFNNLSITVSGAKALFEAQSGKTLTLSKIGLGSGYTTGETLTIKALVAPKMMIPISEKRIDSAKGCMNVIAKMTNESMTEGFYWRETGLFFKDDNNDDILFAYACITDDKYDYIPPFSDQRYMKQIRIANIVTNTDNITVEEPEGLIYVDTITFDAYKADMMERITEYVSNTKQEIAVERARIDQFTSLTEGSTTGDAELADLRVGADGKTYPNAGDAVRGQIGELKGDLDDKSKEFIKVNKSIINTTPYITISALAPFVNGRLFDGVLSTINAKFRVSTDAKIRVEEKTTFFIKDGFQASFQFFNDDGTFKLAGAFATGQYTVNPIYGNNFKIMIARVTEDYSEIADVDEFTSAITIKLSSIEKINTEIEAINTEIEAINNTNLPVYWLDYLNTKKTEIINNKCSIGNHGVYFAYFTDYHNSANVGYTAKILRWLKENTGLNTIIFGGDILKIESTREESLNGLNNFATLFRDLGMMYVFGNHDKNPYGTTENQLNELEDCYPLLFQSNEDKNNIFHTENLFYYFDNPTQKVRFMVLNTHNSTQEIVNDTEQISFMVETLNSTPEGWNIVVLPHIHYELNNGVIELSSASSFVDKIIGDFMNRKSGEKYNVAYDFTQAKANVCTILSGHIHNDYSEMKTYGVPSITTVCDGINAQSTYINPTGERSIGTVTEQAIDLFFIDTEEKTINTVRIGFGENRSFTFN